MYIYMYTHIDIYIYTHTYSAPAVRKLAPVLELRVEGVGCQVWGVGCRA